MLRQSRLLGLSSGIYINLSSNRNIQTQKAIVNFRGFVHFNPMSEHQEYSDYLTSETFIAFDTETTGLWAATNRIVELAGVKFTPGLDRVEEFQEIINPGCPIPADVTAIHGITDDMVTACEPARPVLERFISFCGEDAVLIAHNAPFDISFVGWELFRNDLTFADHLILDSKDIFQTLVPGLPSYSLLSLSRHFNLTDLQAHRALADSRLVYHLFLEAARLVPEISSRNELLDRFGGFRMTDWQAGAGDVPEAYAEIQFAIDHDRYLEIEYVKPDSPPQTRTVRPLKIHNLGATYYLNAFCKLVDSERTFRLDRIQAFRLLKDES